MESCPVCAGPIVGSDLQWIKSAQVVAWGNGAARLSLQEAIVFEALWRARASGEWLPTERLIIVTYGSIGAGNPARADKRIGMLAFKLRAKLAGSGITVRGVQNQGFRIETELSRLAA